MWNVNGITLDMTEGDWGVKLPVTVTGVTFTANDSVRIKIQRDETTIIEKEYTNITQNTFDLEFTEAESALLPVGSYLYSLDWYQGGAFMCNIIPSGMFLVGDKA